VTLPELLIVCATLLALAGIAARALLERDRRRAQATREQAMHERAITAPVAELATAVEQLAAATAALERVAEQAGPARVGHRVTVHTKQPDDQTLYGLVVGDYADRLALEDAEYVTRDGGRPLPGRQDIARADIAWIDVHAHVTPAPDHAPAEAA
jgi:type II secretory pathway pseudopilin PulG